MADSAKKEYFHGEKKCYAEAQRRIKVCAKEGKKELNLYKLHDLSSIPPEIANLKNLRVLNISDCKLKSLPDSFGNMSSLDDLCIHTSKKLKLPESFGNLISLRRFRLYAGGMDALPESFGKCKNLKFLIINDPALAKLPESFTNLTNLKEISLYTFNLKELPVSFGELRALENIFISSGKLAKFPESMGFLKNIKELELDAYTVRWLPESFRNLSYIKDIKVNIGKPFKNTMSSILFNDEEKRRIKSLDINFNDLKYMGDFGLEKTIEQCSIKNLETLILSAPLDFEMKQQNQEIFKRILKRRWNLLKKKFVPSNDNIMRILTVNDKFLMAWKTGFARTKLMIESLYEKVQDKDFFLMNNGKNKGLFEGKYKAKIKLYPETWYKNPITGEWEDEDPNGDIYMPMTYYLDPDFQGEIWMLLGYDDIVKDENAFLADRHISPVPEHYYNSFFDMPDFFKEHNLCNTIHDLYDFSFWTLQDISMINNIIITVDISFQEDTGKF